MMKDLLIAVALTVALSILFSVFCPGPDHITIPPSDGYGPQRPGDRGLVLPGGGDIPAEVSGASETERQEQTTATEETRPQPTQTAQAVQTTGGNNIMPEMLSFWHGVAAVLIGETAALAVAAAWLRIQTKHLRSSGAHKEENK